MRTIGGYRGYREAVDAAFDSHYMMNAALKYSPTYGFYVESDLIRTDSGDVNLGQVFYNLNRGGARSPSSSRREYLETKAKIIEALDGQDAAFDFMNDHSRAFF